nr:MAG TPA: hypothetical protein [Caudoviricetes sp.]
MMLSAITWHSIIFGFLFRSYSFVQKVGMYNQCCQHKEERYEEHENIAYAFCAEQFVEQLCIDIEKNQENHHVFDGIQSIYFHLFHLSNDEFREFIVDFGETNDVIGSVIIANHQFNYFIAIGLNIDTDFSTVYEVIFA